MKKLKIPLLALALFFILQSCSDKLDDFSTSKPIPDVQVVGTRLAFKDRAAYNSTVLQIAKSSLKDFNEWRDKYKFPALYNKIDTSGVDQLKRLPHWQQALINTDGELLIGDTILWYTQNGNIHHIPKINESELASIKSGNPSKNKVETWEVTNVALSPEKIARMNLSGADARYQYQFNNNNSLGSLRKYVFELQNYRSGNNYSLNVNIKLEWYGSKSHNWQSAGEYRYFGWNLFYNATLRNAQAPVGPTVDSYSYSSGDYYDNQAYTVNLYTLYSPPANGSVYWDVEVTGEIHAQMDNYYYPFYYQARGDGYTTPPYLW